MMHASEWLIAEDGGKLADNSQASCVGGSRSKGHGRVPRPVRGDGSAPEPIPDAVRMEQKTNCSSASAVSVHNRSGDLRAWPGIPPSPTASLGYGYEQATRPTRGFRSGNGHAEKILNNFFGPRTPQYMTDSSIHFRLVMHNRILITFGCSKFRVKWSA